MDHPVYSISVYIVSKTMKYVIKINIKFNKYFLIKAVIRINNYTFTFLVNNNKNELKNIYLKKLILRTGLILH